MSEERSGRARETGAAAFAALRRATARKVAEMIRNDPQDAATALEMGLVDRQWLESPGEVPLSSSTPTDVVRRFLERSVERKPSQLNSLGLTAVQLLSSGGDASGADGAAGGAGAVTVVFTDLEGFTAFTEQRGDTAAIAAIDEHHHLAGPVVRGWGGKIVKHLGDGLLCTFPTAESGVRAALDLLGTAPAALRLRAGVHTGEAVVTRTDVIGHVVNVAARVCECAHGGQVLASADVYEVLVSGADGSGGAVGLKGVEFGKVKSRRMKGVKTPVGVCEVVALPPAATAAELPGG